MELKITQQETWPFDLQLIFNGEPIILMSPHAYCLGDTLEKVNNYEVNKKQKQILNKIVRAVNNHDKLVEFVKHEIDHCPRCHGIGFTPNDSQAWPADMAQPMDECMWCRSARELLKDVEG